MFSPLIIVVILIDFSFSSVESFYNPIPHGSLIVSTHRTISIFQPKEYGFDDQWKTIFVAGRNQSIVRTFYNGFDRNLFILFENLSSHEIDLGRLMFVQKLQPNIYRIPIKIINERNGSFSADVENRRFFYTNSLGEVKLYSMSGVMTTTINVVDKIHDTIRSVTYENQWNRYFFISDTTVYSCKGFDLNRLDCCHLSFKRRNFRSLIFESQIERRFGYLIDFHNGVYRVNISIFGCPIDFQQIHSEENVYYHRLAVEKNLDAFAVTSMENGSASSIFIGQIRGTLRQIHVDAFIVDLHLVSRKSAAFFDDEKFCLRGLTVEHYRMAMILAAIFGTVMGILICFNALFSIDFFMTRRIIRELKQQIPCNLFEDRWNKLVEEKYAKLALEIHRKKNDLGVQRKSFTPFGRSNSTGSTRNTQQMISISNPLPIITDYLRRKSESYINRRFNDESSDRRQISRNFPLKFQQKQSTVNEQENQSVSNAHDNPISQTQCEFL